MQKYDVSIVIPVYNSEEFLEECVNSIYNQGYDLSKIQVILINDGSTDNSLEICNKLKEQASDLCIDIITGENHGVAITRNTGIKASQGKYIMFLDSDDLIAENSLKKIIDFFDEHYDEIDLVTYPMFEFYPQKNKRKILKRYIDYFKETRVYDLKKEYEAIQPTMNIVIKNYFEQNVLFRQDIKFNEDTLFNTQVLMKKKKIGYVKEAEYIYRIHGSSTTNSKENPFYSFEQYMPVFEELFEENRDEEGKVPKYVQCLYLNVVRYRILKDKFFPYHLTGKEWDKAYARIMALLNDIENDTIMKYDEMDEYHKIYLLTLKGEELKIVPIFSNKKMALVDKLGNILLVEDYVQIVINRFKAQNGRIYVLGYLKSVLFRYAEPKLKLRYTNNEEDEKIIELELSDNTVANKYRTEIEVGSFYKFEFELNTSKIKEFSLEMTIDGNLVNVEYFFNVWVPFSKEYDVRKIYDGRYRIEFKKNIFFITKPNKTQRKKDMKKNIKKCISFSYKIALFRIFARIYKKAFKRNKKIWLYMDRKNIFDNGYAQFKADVEKKDNIKKYYIIDGKRSEYIKKFNYRERRHLVKFKSFKHKILFLNSDKILTSFSSLQEYSPFWKKYKYYKDILKYELIYLQHGVLHANLLKMYSKETSPIDKFVVSSSFERDNLINNYGYSAKDILCTGMPRFDKKLEIKEPENKIIFAPSWRKYLIGEVQNRERKINVKAFTKSRYYTETISFLTSERLLNLLRENNIILDYKLHPIFEPYKSCFDSVINENITVSIGDTDLNKYKAFITDFSSFQFDYIKLKRPIIYFVPDMKEFRAGLHSYKELDLKYEDAFGNLCLRQEDLVEEIKKVIKNDFKPEEKYKERMETFFFNNKNSREKLYEALK